MRDGAVRIPCKRASIKEGDLNLDRPKPQHQTHDVSHYLSRSNCPCEQGQLFEALLSYGLVGVRELVQGPLTKVRVVKVKAQ